MRTIFMKRAMLGDPPFKARKVGDMKAGDPHEYSEILICVSGLGGGRMQQTRLASDSLLRSLNG